MTGGGGSVVLGGMQSSAVQCTALQSAAVWRLLRLLNAGSHWLAALAAVVGGCDRDGCGLMTGLCAGSKTCTGVHGGLRTGSNRLAQGRDRSYAAAAFLHSLWPWLHMAAALKCMRDLDWVVV